MIPPRVYGNFAPRAHGVCNTLYIYFGMRGRGGGPGKWAQMPPPPCHIQHSPGTPTTGLRARGNDTSKSTGRSGRQTVQGPVKKQQPDGMSRRGSGKWAQPPPSPSHRPGVPAGGRHDAAAVRCGRGPHRGRGGTPRAGGSTRSLPPHPPPRPPQKRTDAGPCPAHGGATFPPQQGPGGSLDAGGLGASLRLPLS